MNNDALHQYINATLNGATPGKSTSSKPAYSINTGSTDATSNLQKQVKDGTVGILLVLNRPTPNQDVQFTYYTNANPVGDSNITQVQGLASQLSILDRASRLGLTPDQTSKLFAQPQITVVIMIVSIFVCAIIAARIYRYGVLMYGQKPSMRQLFKIARMK